MMHIISSHAHDNRMTPSAVAACMAPLLLRPLLAGECELEDDFDMNGDNSAQLLAAANAANNAQAIITTLLEEYDSIFDVRYAPSLSLCIKKSHGMVQVFSIILCLPISKVNLGFMIFLIEDEVTWTQQCSLSYRHYLFLCVGVLLCFPFRFRIISVLGREASLSGILAKCR